MRDCPGLRCERVLPQELVHLCITCERLAQFSPPPVSTTQPGDIVVRAMGQRLIIECKRRKPVIGG